MRSLFCARYVVGLVLAMSSCQALPSYDAYIIVPVADLVGHCLPNTASYDSTSYESNPTFPRIHQVLYQTPVRVLETKGKQALIQVDDSFYITTSHQKPRDTFWTLKKYLVPASIIKGNVKEQLLPFASYTCWRSRPPNKKQLTTVAAFYDPICNLTFSAGTKFIMCNEQLEQDYYQVFALSPTTHRIIRTKLPKDICLQSNMIPSSKEQKIRLFTALIRSWILTAPQNTYIPYVWGGTSIGNPTNSVIQKTDNHPIKVGCDCSGLILRAASICSIPYFFKNSYTACRYLKSLTLDMPLQEGDIIWVPGHVMIVADLKKNTLFEQRGYEHGYGKLHEIPLKKVFKSIKTYKDLLAAYLQKKPLLRMDITGKIRETYSHFMILSLISAWDITYTD